MITSTQNPKVKHLLLLQQKSSLRREEGLFVVEGRREVEHCLEAGFRIRTAFVCEEIGGSFPPQPSLKGKDPPQPSLKGRESFDANSSPFKGESEGVLGMEELPIDRKKPLILNEETIARYIICDNCHPIPGDDVLGYIDENHHIIIHKRQCDIAKRLKANDGNHILAAKWDTHGQLSFPATLHIEGFDRVGVLHQITGILSLRLNVNINKAHIETGDGLFKAEIKLGVHDVRDLQAICHDLKKIEEIEEVKRF